MFFKLLLSYLIFTSLCFSDQLEFKLNDIALVKHNLDRDYPNFLKEKIYKSDGAIYNKVSLDKVNYYLNSKGEIILDNLPKLDQKFDNKIASYGYDGEIIYYNLDFKLQNKIKSLLDNIKASHAAVVMMDPKTGKILALGEKKSSLKSSLLHSGFPAASLFKIITSTAAIDKNKLAPKSLIKYHGGTYTLNKYNYKPSLSRDRKSMTLEDALGKSCNPAFARVALKYLTNKDLYDYARLFGFNREIKFDVPLKESKAIIPNTPYQLSRTAAGFGDVSISPIHAASLISTVANGGYLMEPKLIDKVINRSGRILYQSRNFSKTKNLSLKTSKTLLKMLNSSTTMGTSHKEFKKSKLIRAETIASKTGTLTGKNPQGLNRWFVATAPLSNPEISIAVVTVNPKNSSSKATAIGRKMLEEFFKES